MKGTILTKSEVKQFSFSGSTEMRRLHQEFKKVFRSPVDFEQYNGE